MILKRLWSAGALACERSRLASAAKDLGLASTAPPHPPARQVSGHEFTRAVQRIERDWASVPAIVQARRAKALAGFRFASYLHDKTRAPGEAPGVECTSKIIEPTTKASAREAKKSHVPLGNASGSHT